MGFVLASLAACHCHYGHWTLAASLADSELVVERQVPLWRDEVGLGVGLA